MDVLSAQVLQGVRISNQYHAPCSSGQARRPASYIFLLGPWVGVLAIHSDDKNELSDISKKDRARLESLLKIESKMRN